MKPCQNCGTKVNRRKRCQVCKGLVCSCCFDVTMGWCASLDQSSSLLDACRQRSACQKDAQMKITISKGAIKHMAELYEGEHLAEKLDSLVRMGPIERDLRAIELKPGWTDRPSILDASWQVLLDAVDSLRCRPAFINITDMDADVLSEAIEAAEALNL